MSGEARVPPHEVLDPPLIYDVFMNDAYRLQLFILVHSFPRLEKTMFFFSNIRQNARSLQLSPWVYTRPHLSHFWNIASWHFKPTFSQEYSNNEICSSYRTNFWSRNKAIERISSRSHYTNQVEMYLQINVFVVLMKVCTYILRTNYESIEHRQSERTLSILILHTCSENTGQNNIGDALTLSRRLSGYMVRCRLSMALLNMKSEHQGRYEILAHQIFSDIKGFSRAASLGTFPSWTSRLLNSGSIGSKFPQKILH